jgi:hypothetical protein
MPVNPAQFAGTGADTEALFLKRYADNFIAAPRSGIFLFGGPSDRYIFRPTVAGGGKEWQYLIFAEVPDAEEFEPGQDLLGQVMAIQEGVLTTDKYMVCHQWIGKDKMAQSHFQVLPQLAERHRSRLERLYDRRAMIKACLGARQTSAVTKNGLNVHSGGTRVTRTGGTVATAYPLSATGCANLRADIRSLGLSQSQKNIAPGPQNRGLLMDPYLMTVLSFDSTGQLFSRDYVTTNDQQRHEVKVLENFAVLGEPNTTSNGGPLPNENILDGPARYQGNFTAQAADGIPGVLALCRSQEGEYGIGSVEFEKISHMVKWFPEKLAWLVMTFARNGMDVMHPWCLGSCEVII